MVFMFQCKKCLQFLDDSCFYRSNSCKSGHGGKCKSCKIQEQKLYAITHREQVNAVHRNWYATHKEYEAARVKIWTDNNRDKRRSYNRTFKQKHPEARLSLPIRTARWLVSLHTKPLVLKRDGYACILCKSALNLKCHHILPANFISDSAKLHDRLNLVTLCGDCHLKAHLGNYNKLDFLLASTLLLMAEQNSLSVAK